MSRPEIIRFMEGLSQDPGFVRKVAYGRIYYLNEPEMVLGLGLNERDSEFSVPPHAKYAA